MPSSRVMFTIYIACVNSCNWTMVIWGFVHYTNRWTTTSIALTEPAYSSHQYRRPPPCYIIYTWLDFESSSLSIHLFIKTYTRRNGFVLKTLFFFQSFHFLQWERRRHCNPSFVHDRQGTNALFTPTSVSDKCFFLLLPSRPFISIEREREKARECNRQYGFFLCIATK